MSEARIAFLKRRWNWRWTLLAVAALILVCTVIYAWLRPELYRSETLIVVTPETVFDRALSNTEAKDSIENQIQNVQQMLASRTVLQRIIDEFNLRAGDTSEDALMAIRSNLGTSRTSGNTLTIACSASDPGSSQSIMRRLTEILLQRNRESLMNRAAMRDEFLDQELHMRERNLAAMNAQIIQVRMTHSGERQELQQQAMLHEQARLQRQVDEIDGMKLNAAMAVNFLKTTGSAGLEILDQASLPERPVFPARSHIVWTGMVLATIVALPAAFVRRKAPRDSA